MQDEIVSSYGSKPVQCHACEKAQTQQSQKNIDRKTDSIQSKIKLCSSQAKTSPSKSLQSMKAATEMRICVDLCNNLNSRL